MNLKVEHNSGIINLGNHTHNTVVHITQTPTIDWTRLSQELKSLQNAPDKSIQKFVQEGAAPIEKKDTGGLKKWLSKWLPCIREFIETSYYILEIAAKFGIL